jgi:hypothetical protein
VIVIDWLLDGDPAIRWQVLRDLVNAPAGDVAAERARVEHAGWGARLLALEDPGGLWDGGACFPASYTGGEPAQPWTATMHTLQTLQLLRARPGGRWLIDRIHPGRVYFDLEGGVGTPSRWNTLRALRVLKWWDGIARA